MAGAGTFHVCLIASVAGCLAVSGSRALADYPFHADADRIVVTRGDTVVSKLPCERITLDNHRPISRRRAGQSGKLRRLLARWPDYLCPDAGASTQVIERSE